MYPTEYCLIIAPFDGRDLAGSIHFEASWVKNVMQSIQLTVQKERVHEAEDAIKDREQEKEDPTYVPESFGESDFSEEVHFSTAVRKTNTEAVNTATKLPSTTESSIIEPGKSTQTTRQRPMSPAADDSAATQTPSKKSRVSLDTAGLHHRKCVCPVCGKEDTNLKRHLNSHARKGHIETSQVDKLFSVTVKDKDTRGQGRRTNSCKLTGLPFKWCPVEGCETVTHLLRSHLTDTPHIKSSALLEHYLHVVRSYRGQKEVEDMMQSIELARRSSQPAKHMSATSELKRTASSAKPPPSTTVTCTSSTLESLIASTSQDISTEDIEGESSEEKGDKEDKSLVEDERTIDYLIVANPRDNRQKWLCLFYTYLNTPSCGRKKT